MTPTRLNHDHRSEQTANAALLAIMLLLTSGAALQLQSPAGRLSTFSSRDSMMQRTHATTPDLLICNEVSLETELENTSAGTTLGANDTTRYEGRSRVIERRRRNLPPPHRA
jgi:hypothetical protein